MVLVYTCVAKAAPRQAYQCTVRALGSALAQVARRRAQAGGAPAYHKVVVQRDKAHFFKQKFGTIWVKKSSVFRVIWGADGPMISANVVCIDLYDSVRSSACLSGVEDKSV